MAFNPKYRKVGNLLLLFAQRHPILTLTKALKMLAAIDEQAVRERGYPVTWLNYKAWHLGPVPVDVYHISQQHDVDKEVTSILRYVTFAKGGLEGGNEVVIAALPGSAFEEDQFSEYDIEIIESILRRYQEKNSTESVYSSHNPKGAWALSIGDSTLIEELESKARTTTDIDIDFSKVINDEGLLKVYRFEVEENQIKQSLLKWK